VDLMINNMCFLIKDHKFKSIGVGIFYHNLPYSTIVNHSSQGVNGLVDQ
jgi:hypothetical protein